MDSSQPVPVSNGEASREFICAEDIFHCQADGTPLAVSVEPYQPITVTFTTKPSQVVSVYASSR